MPHLVPALDETHKQQTLTVDRIPDHCPVCKNRIKPTAIQGFFLARAKRPIRIAFLCPTEGCHEIFVAAYTSVSDAVVNATCRLQSTSLLRPIEEFRFPPTISSLSEMFCKTFNQSNIAEENGLDQIAGPGYRKSLEFLIKDFLLKYKYKDHAETQEKIQKAFLAICIEQYIDEDRIKHCAKRAAWLGNDEVHYTRKWESKDIHDLKALITMTVSWIDLVMQSDEYLKIMPEE